MKDVLLSLLIVAGTLLILTGAIGLVRLPDVLCRSHAVAKALTLGIFLLLLGLWGALGETAAAFKILLAIFFQVITIPVAGHLISRLAFRQDIARWRHRPMDDHRVPKATPERRPGPDPGEVPI